jgi:S-adenosylmethionine decarboxylase
VPAGVVLPTTAEEATRMAGIDRLLPGSHIDSFLFEPCGYSCNGFLGDAFFTIHITPEAHCSFVSFETNVKLANYDELTARVLQTFNPGRFTISLFVDEGSLVRNSMKALPSEIAG